MAISPASGFRHRVIFGLIVPRDPIPERSTTSKRGASRLSDSAHASLSGNSSMDSRSGVYCRCRFYRPGRRFRGSLGIRSERHPSRVCSDTWCTGCYLGRAFPSSSRGRRKRMRPMTHSRKRRSTERIERTQITKATTRDCVRKDHRQLPARGSRRVSQMNFRRLPADVTEIDATRPPRLRRCRFRFHRPIRSRTSGVYRSPSGRRVPPRRLTQRMGPSAVIRSAASISPSRYRSSWSPAIG